jgi:plastocyanin
MALAALGALALPAAAFARPFQGTVGPGATISLKRPNGTTLTHARPGLHRFAISDLSSFHNFHLSGPAVNRKTGIAFTGSRSWRVTLSAGTYRFRCDVHPTTMHGSFSVS